MRLTSPDNEVLVSAGLPGAGKTTPIRRTVDRGAARVVESTTGAGTVDAPRSCAVTATSWRLCGAVGRS